MMVIPGFPVNDGDVKRMLNIIQGFLSQISTATLDLQIIGMDQFAMVEELALLIKDNLPCKHLILSMEDCPSQIPSTKYMLRGCLGAPHESVGEGDDHHLNLDLNRFFFLRCGVLSRSPISLEFFFIFLFFYKIVLKRKKKKLYFCKLGVSSYPHPT
ncbi:hypothetical protein AMTRI_Chr11g94980 [Amborella trichopoda]